MTGNSIAVTAIHVVDAQARLMVRCSTTCGGVATTKPRIDMPRFCRSDPDVARIAERLAPA